KLMIKKKRKIKIFFLIIFIGVLIYGFYFLKRKTLKFLWNLESFKIKEIKIYPENITPLIKAILELEKDKNLLFLNAEELRERINSISEVENCKVTKIYPSTIQIDIILRKPWAIIENEYIIDRNGIILNENKNNIALLPIYGVKVDKMKNKVIEIEKVYILKEFDRWYNYYNIGNLFKINKIDISDVKKIEISNDGKKIYFTKEDIKDKIENLSVILKNLKDDFEYIDTRFKNFYIKLKNERQDNNID
ncbi:MAG: FtsQ-type POTRA domain-containing protein, partial [Candidatus Omnitrophica bacterium]|nr:FtsQ-type POTRA domain-containing protein [Candidatus Omnitrophota bacterium]